jgi:hypothetical protein
MPKMAKAKIWPLRILGIKEKKLGVEKNLGVEKMMLVGMETKGLKGQKERKFHKP